jgi:hypothetical protein
MAPVGPEPGLANSSLTCSASAQGCSDALGLGSVSAQVKSATAQVWKRNGYLVRSILAIVYIAIVSDLPRNAGTLLYLTHRTAAQRLAGTKRVARLEFLKSQSRSIWSFSLSRWTCPVNWPTLSSRISLIFYLAFYVEQNLLAYRLANWAPVA